MRKTTALFFFVSLLLVNFAYASGDCDGVHMGSHSDMSGVSTLFCASFDVVMKTPEWDGESDTLPLKLSEATSIGRRWLKKTNPKLDDFQIREISISRVGDSQLKDRWYYSLSFQAVIGGRTLFGPPFLVKILMDGSVVESKITKD